jgi:hypothetical protein
MRYEDIELTGSLNITGSFNVPYGVSGSNPSNPKSGSLFFNTTDNVLEEWNGNWRTIGSSSPSISIASADIEYLVVAGGSSGGRGLSRSGGGGGAGGYISSSLSSIESGSLITVTVGAGGAAVSSDGSGNDGGDSSIASSTGTNFTTVTSTGGGGGGYPGSGRDGGSGGGGAHGSQVGGSGISGQGFDGGDGFGEFPYSAGGGGGASEVGEDSSADVAGDGGDGKASSITGTSTTYAGGGGGGGGGTAGSGGTGGGGAGSSSTGTSGTANTGGGGGGARSTSGAGGSGVVILAYPTASISATGGIRTFFNDRVAHTFNSSGTFTVGGLKTYTHNTLDVFGDSSCLALYTLDGNANDTGGTYNGTASNITYNQSYINNGGVFNGSSSKITVSGLSSMFGSKTTFSVSLWFKTTATGNRALFDDYNFTNYNIQLYLYDGNLNVSVRFNNSDSNMTTSSSTYNDGNWHHVVVTSDQSTYYTYVDGSQIRTWSAPGSSYSGGSPVPTIGASTHPPSTVYNYWDGNIDQVRIFNKALSSTEVATLYNE